MRLDRKSKKLVGLSVILGGTLALGAGEAIADCGDLPRHGDLEAALKAARPTRP